LPGSAGAGLLEVARDAFVQGMHTTSLIAAVVATGIAVLAFVVLRNLQTGAGESGGPDAESDAGDDRSSGEARGWAAAAEA
jgi:MFS transporter, DHA2 family, multidrug resistance protein